MTGTEQELILCDEDGGACVCCGRLAVASCDVCGEDLCQAHRHSCECGGTE